MGRPDHRFNSDELISGIRRSDPGAFRQLYDHFYLKVFKFSLNIIHNKEEAEEVVQDVFLKIWQKRMSLDHHRSLNGYVFKITKNLTLNKLRKKVGEPTTFTPVSNRDFAVNQTEEEVFLHETDLILKEAIEAMSPKRQKIFKMSRFEGISNQEIASRLSISVNTVEGQIRKAIKYLKSYIEFTVTLFFSFW